MPRKTEIKESSGAKSNGRIVWIEEPEDEGRRADEQRKESDSEEEWEEEDLEEEEELEEEEWEEESEDEPPNVRVFHNEEKVFPKPLPDKKATTEARIAAIFALISGVWAVGCYLIAFYVIFKYIL